MEGKEYGGGALSLTVQVHDAQGWGEGDGRAWTWEEVLVVVSGQERSNKMRGRQGGDVKSEAWPRWWR